MAFVRPALIALGIGLLLAGPTHGQPGPSGSLAGVWKLNNELSDKMEEKLRDALREGAYYGSAGRGLHRWNGPIHPARG